MSEQSTEEENATKRDKLRTAIEVAVTTGVIASTNAIKFPPNSSYEFVPKLLAIFAPLIGLGVAGTVTYYVNEYRDDRTERRIKKYIQELEEQIKDESSTPEQKADARQEQILHKQDLIELRRRRNKRDIA